MATLEALWTTAPLTTPAALIERSAQAGRLVNLLRADRETWDGLSDDERRATVRRLQFQAWRLNRDDRLRTRTVREGPTMRGWTASLHDLATLAAIVGALFGVALARLRGHISDDAPTETMIRRAIAIPLTRPRTKDASDE